MSHVERQNHKFDGISFTSIYFCFMERVTSQLYFAIIKVAHSESNSVFIHSKWDRLGPLLRNQCSQALHENQFLKLLGSYEIQYYNTIINKILQTIVLDNYHKMLLGRAYLTFILYLFLLEKCPTLQTLPNKDSKQVPIK